MSEQDRWERHVELKAALAGDLDWPAEALPAPTRPEHCGHVLSACGCPNPPDPEQAYEAVRSMLTEALDRAHRAEDANDALRSELAAAAERRGYERAIEVLRPVLVEHFLFSLNCDHEAKTDTPWCGCAAVDLGTHPTVGDAVQAWVDHVMAVASSLVKGDSER